MADEKIKQLLKEVRQGKKVPNLSVQNVLPNFIEVEFGEKIRAIANPQERQQYRDSLTNYYASGAGRATIDAIISDMEYQYARALRILTGVAVPGGGGDINVIDNLLSESPTDALSANQGRLLKSYIDAGYIFKGFLHPEDDGTAVCDYPVCYLTGISGVYYGYGNLNVDLDDGELALIYRAKNSTRWDYVTTKISGSGGGYIGYSAVQDSARPQSLFGITHLNATNVASSSSRIVWDTTNNAWHFYGNIYADGWIAAGGIGSGGGGGGGSTVVVTQRLTTGTPIADIEVDGVTTTLYAPSGGGGGGGGYIGYTAVQQSAQSQNLFGIPYLNATNEASSASRMVWDSSLDAWHFYGNIYADGWISSGGVGSGGGGGGTGVTSVAMTVPTSELSVAGTPITTEGTLALSWVNQSQNKVLASPVNTTGTPSFRALVTADIPDLSGKYVTLDTTQNNISGAKTFTTKTNFTGGLAVDGGSYLDIGNVRLVYDSNANALHVTKKDGTTGTIGFYADGFVAAGGVEGGTPSYVDLESNQTVGGNKTFTGTTYFGSGQYLVSINNDEINYGSRLYIQYNSNDLCLTRTGKTIIGGYPGSEVIGSNKLYVDGSAIATVWNTTSDFRLKDDISVLKTDEAIEKLMALKPSIWKWNSGLAKGMTASGFIAQEVESVLPFMVTGEDYKGLAYQMFHAYEVSAIQSHEERIMALEKKVKTMDG